MGKPLLGELGDNSNTIAQPYVETSYWGKWLRAMVTIGLKPPAREICGTGYNAFGQIGMFRHHYQPEQFPLCIASGNLCCYGYRHWRHHPGWLPGNPTERLLHIIKRNRSGAGTFTVDGGASQPYTTNPFTITGLAKGNHTIVVTVTGAACTSNALAITIGQIKLQEQLPQPAFSLFRQQWWNGNYYTFRNISVSRNLYRWCWFSRSLYYQSIHGYRVNGIFAVYQYNGNHYGLYCACDRKYYCACQYTGTATNKQASPARGATNGTATITLSGFGASAPEPIRLITVRHSLIQPILSPLRGLSSGQPYGGNNHYGLPCLSGRVSISA